MRRAAGRRARVKIPEKRAERTTRRIHRNTGASRRRKALVRAMVLSP
jgi:hypothetical protein